MYRLTPENYPDIRSILINRLPYLSDTEVDILVDIFMSI
jgi:hypothetical protein